MRHSCTTGREEDKLWQWWETEWVRPVDGTLNVPDTSSENNKMGQWEADGDGQLGDNKKMGVEEHQVGEGVLGGVR